MIRALLLALALFDLGLGLVGLLGTSTALSLLWPSAGPDAASLLQRTSWLWLAFSLFQFMAWQKPSPERLRGIACLRWMEVPADAWWALSASGLSPLGFWAIAVCPPLNLLFGLVVWRSAKKAERAPQ